jgi:uncharacterized protein
MGLPRKAGAMNGAIKGTAFLLYIALSAGAKAASFDCKLAKSPVEKAVCASKELSAADDAMAAEYKSVLAAVPAEVQGEVRNDQRSWLRNMIAACNKEPQAKIAECVKGTYASQMDVLKKRVTTVSGVRFVVRSVELKSKDAADDPWKGRDAAGLEKNAGYGTLTAEWPQALNDSPDWKAWNAAVLHATMKMAGADDKSGYKWSDDMAAGTETDITTTIDRVGAQLVSASVSADNMGHGAAHPSEGYESFHWMLKEQRALKVSDVFQTGSTWEKIVSTACRASLRKQVGADYASYAAGDFASTLSKLIRNPANWTLDDKGLSISFPEYSVTPRVEPVDPVTVSWTALQPYLSKGFAIPR